MKIFNTVQDLKEARLTAGQLTETKGKLTVGDGGGAKYLIQETSGVGALSESLANGNWAVMQSGVLLDDITVYIPSDYPTLQEAIDDLSKLQVAQGAIIELMIESGHSVTSGIEVSDGDYSHFFIRSQDPVVLSDSSYSSQSFIISYRSRAPVLDCLVDFEGLRGNYGYYLRNASVGNVRPGAGVINLGGTGASFNTGLFVNEASSVDAFQAIFTGNTRNLWVTMASTANCLDCNFDGSTGDFAVHVVRNSLAHLSMSTIDNASQNGVYSNNSNVTLLDATVDGAGTNAIIAEYGGVIYTRERVSKFSAINAGQYSCLAKSGGTIVALDATLTGAGASTVRCEAAAVHVNGSDLSNSIGTAVSIVEGGAVYAKDAVINSAGLDAINCQSGSSVLADGASMTTSGRFGIWAQSNSRVTCGGATISGSANNGVRAQSSEITTGNASITGNTGADIDVRNGGIIRAAGTTTTNGAGAPAIGDTNQGSFNSINVNGIIFA